MSIQVCSDCHKPFNKEGLLSSNLCSGCETRKKKEAVTKFDSQNWVKFIENLRDRDWTHHQLACPKHHYVIVPNSGKYLGISLWRCVYCDGVVQST